MGYSSRSGTKAGHLDLTLFGILSLLSAREVGIGARAFPREKIPKMGMATGK